VVKLVKKTDCWAAAVGDIFKNPYALATSGQQHFTRLADDREEQQNEDLAEVNVAFSVPLTTMRLLAETWQIPRQALPKTHRRN